jgi:hypothetical protein
MHDQPNERTVPTVKVTELRQEARDYYRLCDEAEALGIPTSLDDPDSPKTVQGLRDAVEAAHG